MTNLPIRGNSRKPGGVETPRLADDAGPFPPYEARPRRLRGRHGTLVDELLDERASTSVIVVARALDEWSRSYGRSGTWVSARKLGQLLDLGISTVRAALKWLESHGWIVRSLELYRGRSVRVHWCLWLLPDDWAGCEVAFPEGVKYRVGPTSDSPAARAPTLPFGREGARFSAPRGARFSAQDSSNELNRIKDVNVAQTSTSTLAAPGGGEDLAAPEIPVDPMPIDPASEPIPSAPPIDLPAAPTPGLNPINQTVAPVDPPPPSPPSDEAVAEWDRVCRSPRSRDFERKIAASSLFVCGRLPEDLTHLLPRIDPAPSRPAPDRPRYFVPTATPAPPAPSSVEDLIRRLPGAGAAAPARALELAGRLAREWDDFGSLHGFVPKLLRVARGEIPLKRALKALTKARKCGPDATPGAIFHFNLNAGGPP